MHFPENSWCWCKQCFDWRPWPVLATNTWTKMFFVFLLQILLFEKFYMFWLKTLAHFGVEHINRLRSLWLCNKFFLNVFFWNKKMSECQLCPKILILSQLCFDLLLFLGGVGNLSISTLFQESDFASCVLIACHGQLWDWSWNVTRVFEPAFTAASNFEPTMITLRSWHR